MPHLNKGLAEGFFVHQENSLIFFIWGLKACPTGTFLNCV